MAATTNSGSKLGIRGATVIALCLESGCPLRSGLEGIVASRLARGGRSARDASGGIMLREAETRAPVQFCPGRSRGLAESAPARVESLPTVSPPSWREVDSPPPHAHSRQAKQFIVCCCLPRVSSVIATATTCGSWRRTHRSSLAEVRSSTLPRRHRRSSAAASWRTRATTRPASRRIRCGTGGVGPGPRRSCDRAARLVRGGRCRTSTRACTKTFFAPCARDWSATCRSCRGFASTPAEFELAIGSTTFLLAPAIHGGAIPSGGAVRRARPRGKLAP